MTKRTTTTFPTHSIKLFLPSQEGPFEQKDIHIGWSYMIASINWDNGEVLLHVVDEVRRVDE